MKSSRVLPQFNPIKIASFVVLSVFLFLTYLVSCSDDDPADDDIFQPDPISNENQFTADGAGGVFNLSSGIVVTIPEGAIVGSKEITITELNYGDANTLSVIPISANTSYLFGITINTDQFDFTKPIRIKIPIQNLDGNALAVLYELNEDIQKWVFAGETIVVNNADKYIEILFQGTESSSPGKSATSKKGDSMNFVLKNFNDVLEDEDPCRKKVYRAIEESNDNTSSSGCSAAEFTTVVTYTDFDPVQTDVLLIREISPACPPEYSIEVSNKVKVEDSKSMNIETSIGGLVLPEQEIQVTPNNHLSISPGNQATDQNGNAQFTITGEEVGEGQIDITISFNYYLTTISSVGGGQEERNRYDQARLTLSTERGITVYDLPLVTTSFYTNDDDSIAFAGGEVTEDWEDEVTERGIELNGEIIPLGDGLGSFEAQLFNLQPNETYKVKAYAINEAGTAYGEEIGFVLDIDGNIYRSVVIGELEWITENLKTTRFNNGTSIFNVINPRDLYDTIPNYSWYNNNPTNKHIYGALYNTDAVITGILCPPGWHVGSMADYESLIELAGGWEVGGGKLKEVGTSHWNPPNTGATDEFGLTALPGGYRIGHWGTFDDEDFIGLGEHGLWWTSTFNPGTMYNNTHLLWVGLSYNSQDAGKATSGYSSRWGACVRCVKN